ncbi:MAG: S8 family serine peptidase [Candidatus Heimdallarchaeota archaeon]
MGRNNFTKKTLVLLIIFLVLFTNFTMVSSFYLIKNQQKYLITKNDTIENHYQKSLIEPKGYLLDIGSGDPILNISKYYNTMYDATLFDYMGLNQIHRDLSNGISGFDKRQGTSICVAVVDNLIDFKHPNLTRAFIDEDDNIYWLPAVTKAVLINNEVLGGENAYVIVDDLYNKDPYSTANNYFDYDKSFRDYMDSSFWGHGTSVAGIINQVAPGAEIISVAIPYCSTLTQLYNAVMNLLTFLEQKKEELNIKIVNHSMAWQSESLVLNQNKKDAIETKIHDLLTCEDETKLFWVNAAGNKEVDENNNWNIVYPSHLADNWEAEFASNYDANIIGKVDYDNNQAIATGFVSVGSVYDSDYLCGLRSNEYVFDCDMDNTGDLKLMAPGFFTRTTTNTVMANGTAHPTDQIYFTGTSAAAPVVSGLAALLRSVSYLEGYQLEKKITENAVYDSHVNLGSQERLQKYGHGMINPLETLKSYDADLVDFDTDGEGLKDVDELYIYHSNIDEDDTDTDGWTDFQEASTYYTDPTDIDSDNDNIYDKAEYLWWINTIGVSSSLAKNYIKDKDVDNDLLSDGYEKYYDFDPLDNDMDNDGLLDGLEVLADYNYFTDPEDPDSDNDGYDDLDEITNGTDPNDPNDYPGSGGWGWG